MGGCHAQWHKLSLSKVGSARTDWQFIVTLLALHRQGSKGEPSFNACRETCRELCYYYNLVTSEPEHPEAAKRIQLAVLVARHLLLFVSGKMQVENLGEFCCSSRPVRSRDEMVQPSPNQQLTQDISSP